MDQELQYYAEKMSDIALDEIAIPDPETRKLIRAKLLMNAEKILTNIEDPSSLTTEEQFCQIGVPFIQARRFIMHFFGVGYIHELP